MKNKFFTDKFVPAPKFAGVGRMEDYYGEGFNKGYDSGFPYEADFGIFNSPAFRRSFPAVLQCGGYGDCRALFGRERAGWGGGYGFPELYDHGLLHGSVQRFCNSGGSQVRGKGLFRHASGGGEQRVAVGGFFCCHDHGGSPAVPEYSHLDENPGGYFRVLLRIHTDYFSGDSGHLSL